MRLKVLLLLLVLGVGCSGNKDNQRGLESEGDGAAVSVTATPEIPPVTYHVAFIQADDLFALSSTESTPPRQLAEDVHTTGLYTSPNHHHALFATTGRSGKIYRMDFDTNEHLPLVDAETFWYPFEWSPDQEWVILIVGFDNLYVVKLDGTVSHQIGNASATAFWLLDGTVLITEQTFSQDRNGNFQSQITKIERFDPFTAEYRPFQVDLNAVNQNYAVLGDVLRTAGLLVAPNQSFYSALPQSFDTREFCQKITFLKHEAGNISYREAFTIDNTWRISNFMYPSEDTVLYLEWSIPNCTINAAPLVKLQRLSTSTNEASTISDTVFGGLNFNQFDNSNTGNFPLISLTPDNQNVIWVGHDSTGNLMTINQTSVETNATTTLYTDANARSRFITAVAVVE